MHIKMRNFLTTLHVLSIRDCPNALEQFTTIFKSHHTTKSEEHRANIMSAGASEYKEPAHAGVHLGHKFRYGEVIYEPSPPLGRMHHLVSLTPSMEHSLELASTPSSDRIASHPQPPDIQKTSQTQLFPHPLRPLTSRSSS